MCDTGAVSETRPPMSVWVLGARPRTLPAAVVPVAVGAGAASVVPGQDARWWAGALALVVSVALQVGVNYANDYSDGVRGVDRERVGPTRLVGSGIVGPSAVRNAAFTAFGVAAISGLVIAAAVNWWLLLVGAVSVAAGWLYTGGPRPYGYLGLGEVFVFVFFGLVATAGTQFVIGGSITLLGVVAAIAVGLLAVALLIVNNLRDIPGDRAHGKKTLAVRIGDRATRRLYVGVVVAAFVCVVLVGLRESWALLGLIGAVWTLAPIQRVLRGERGQDLIVVLGSTARVQLITGLCLALGLLLA